METLTGGEVSNSLLGELCAGHNLYDVEGGPADVVAAHLEVSQLEDGVGLDRQVVLPQLLLDLLQALSDVLGLVVLVVPYAADQVIHVLVEHPLQVTPNLLQRHPRSRLRLQVYLLYDLPHLYHLVCQLWQL